MAYRALAYRSHVARFLGLNIRAVAPMSSLRRVTPHPSPLPSQLNGQNTPLVTVSLFSTTTSHGRGGFGMEEAEEGYAIDHENEEEFSRSRREQEAEPTELNMEEAEENH